MPLTDSLSDAVAECIRLVEPPPTYERVILQARSSREIVSMAVNSTKHEQDHLHNVADRIFLSAVLASGTHPDLVNSISLADAHQVTPIKDAVGTFLRYADAIDNCLESFANTCFPAAVLFACIRFMISVAVKEMKLFRDVKSQFDEINLRLRRLDTYLGLSKPTAAIQTMLCKVMADNIRFCGLATKYLKSNYLLVFVSQQEIFFNAGQKSKINLWR
jgi:hypothetical protein